MDKIRALLSLKKVSIFLIALPYLTFNYERIVHSPFFSIPQFVLFLAGLFTIDILVKWLISLLKDKKEQTFSLFVVFFVMLFFFAIYITNYIQKLVSENFNILIRGRTMIELGVVIFLVLIYILRKKTISYKYFNFFLLFFSIITLITSIKKNNNKKVDEFKNKYINIAKNHSSVKPVILIISDEYTSPNSLFNICKDSSIYNFSNQLIKNGWIVKNSFYSYETSTIHSLSSLFNFNLSTNHQYSQQAVSDIGASKLMHAAIADSFKRKNVDVINFGIFHIGEHPFLTHLYMYPKSLFEDIIMSTIYYTIKYNTGNFNEHGLTSSFYPMEIHNKYIFKNLQDTLNKTNNTNTFVYAHLYMPHSPMQFDPEFPIREKNNLTNYIAYWNFTNNKLEDLLLALIKQNKYRIILTGDHGYRSDSRINLHYTFTAFWGFEKSSLECIKSVQDIGSLIISEF